MPDTKDPIAEWYHQRDLERYKAHAELMKAREAFDRELAACEHDTDHNAANRMAKVRHDLRRAERRYEQVSYVGD